MEGEDPAPMTAAEEVAPEQEVAEPLEAAEEQVAAQDPPADDAAAAAADVENPNSGEPIPVTEEVPANEEAVGDTVGAEEVAEASAEGETAADAPGADTAMQGDGGAEEDQALTSEVAADAGAPASGENAEAAPEGLSAVEAVPPVEEMPVESQPDAPAEETPVNALEEPAPAPEPEVIVTAPEELPPVQDALEVHVEDRGKREETNPPSALQSGKEQVQFNAPPEPNNKLNAPQQRQHQVGRQPMANAGMGGVPPRPNTNNSGRGSSRRGMDDGYEQDVGAVLAGDIMPAQFRRGFDNSHINRMSQGSYSRYLLSSGVISDEQLYASFLGDTPVPGYMPFRGDHAADLETRRGNTRASSQRGNRNNRPGRYPGDNLSSTMGATMSSTIRREMEILDEPMYNELGAQRARRRRDPEHCVDPRVTDQHYYNQKSKAYFVPQDQNPNAAVLQYNHLYDFGDGSRFKSGPGEPARRNPNAPPPRTYAENKQAAAAIDRSRPPTKGTGSVANRRREEIEKGSSSLRTAKAVDVQKLHCSQFRQTRSIEDVIASDPTYVARSTEGIRSVVDSGKMDWSELPNRLQTVMSAERYKKRPGSSGKLYAPYRPPPQPSPPTVPNSGGRHQQNETSLPPVNGAYEVSRISFTKRYEPNATPSAFVDKRGELEPLIRAFCDTLITFFFSLWVLVFHFLHPNLPEDLCGVSDWVNELTDSFAPFFEYISISNGAHIYYFYYFSPPRTSDDTLRNQILDIFSFSWTLSCYLEMYAELFLILLLHDEEGLTSLFESTAINCRFAVVCLIFVSCVKLDLAETTQIGRMSRYGGAGGESKVYVNNMNTRYPAVDIPGRVSKLKNMKSLRPRNPDMDLDDLSPERAEDVPVSFDAHSRIALSNGDELHQNLEAAYERIMKRLQREVNYEEISRVPLATQYGIQWEGNGGGRPSQLGGSLTGLDGEVEGSSGGSGADKAVSNLAAISRLAREAAEKPSITSFRVERVKKEEQPCPDTLRLVIQHVAQTLLTKLELAVRGSLRDTLRFIFESKALLDRLLKEIPTYNTFQGNAETLPMTQKGAQSTHMHEMFQQFRKLPVVIPHGQFAREAASGAVVPVLNVVQGSGGTTSLGATLSQSGAEMGAEMSPKAEALPPVAPAPSTVRPLTPISTRSMVGQYTEMAKGIMKGGESEIGEDDIPLPPGYAKSARVNPEIALEMGTPHGGPTTLKPFLSEAPQPAVASIFQSPAKTEQSRPPTGEDRDKNVAPNLNVSTSLSKTGVHRTPGRGGTRRAEFSLCSQKAYRARLTDAATLTEENTTNIVRREDYDTLYRYCRELEVQVAEARREMNDALEKLIVEKDHTNVRTRVIKYIRETIFRECNVLRSQLQMAELKEHQLQQRLASANTAAVHSARSGPVERTTSFSVAGGRQRLATKSSRGPVEDSSGSDLPENTRMRASEVTRVQSLLDLAMMAVESEAVLSPEDWNAEVVPDVSTLRHPKREMDEVVAFFEHQQRVLKERIIAIKVNHSHIIAAKDDEIARLRKLADIQYVRETLVGAVQDLRQELRKTKNSIYEALNTFRIAMMGSLTTLENRSVLVDQQLQEYKALKSSQMASMDLIRSASALFLPMLTDEYARGYHPWPAKLRNTIDPLSQVVLSKHGSQEVIRLREPLIHFSDMYIAIHKYVTSQLVVPDVTRPTTGRHLSQVCSAMVLSPLTTIDMVYNIRLRYDKELQLKKQIAIINSQILWKAHLQRVKTERCISALLEGNMDPHTTTLPVSRTVNQLAEGRGLLSKERSALQKERLDNAKELYRLWKDRQIDIFEGYAPPITQNRVALLNNAQVSGIRNATEAAVRTQPGGSKLMPMMAMGDGRIRRSVNICAAQYDAAVPSKCREVIYSVLVRFLLWFMAPCVTYRLSPRVLTTLFSSSIALLFFFVCVVVVVLFNEVFKRKRLILNAYTAVGKFKSKHLNSFIVRNFVLRVASEGGAAGYGPFSSTVRNRVVPSEHEKGTIEKNVHLESNKNLRASLASLPHPRSLESTPYRSELWQRAMVRLYRTILRLHNKPIAVSLSESLSRGPSHAVSAVMHRQPSSVEREGGASSPAEPVLEDCLLRFLLSDEQRAFGNHFVQSQFAAHMDVDSLTAMSFYESWYQYILQLASGDTHRDLTPHEKRMLSEEQKGKLEDLHRGVMELRSTSSGVANDSASQAKRKYLVKVGSSLYILLLFCCCCLPHLLLPYAGKSVILEGAYCLIAHDGSGKAQSGTIDFLRILKGVWSGAMRRNSISSSHLNYQDLQPPPKTSVVKEISQPPNEDKGMGGPSKYSDSSKGSNRSEETHYGAIKPPPRRKPNALPSGTHIQRRPISAHRDGNGNGNGSGAGQGSPQPSRMARDRNRIGLSSPTTDGRRDAVKPLRFERRADPSPAPSRPPRANRRKLAPTGITVFHEVQPQPQRHAPLSGSTTSIGGGTPLKDKNAKLVSASPTSTSGLSSTSTLIRRQGKEVGTPGLARGTASRLPATAVKPKDRSERRGVEERLAQYLAACEQDGETANEEWIAVVQKYLGGEGAESVSSPDISLRNIQQDPAGGYEYSGIGKILRPPEGSNKVKSAFQAPKISTPVKAGRRNGGLTSSLGQASGAAQGEDPLRNAAESVLEKMAAYCRQRHSAMRFKKDVIMQKRQDVAAALEAFRLTYQDLAAWDVKEVPSGVKAPPSLQSTVTPSDSRIDKMKANAERLTSSLHNVQLAVVQLLLRLQDYAKEVRKPLGISSAGADSDVPKPGSLAHSAAAGPNGKNFFTAFTEFVTQQEREIAKQLREVQETVENTLSHSDWVSIEDAGILQTPLFCRSTGAAELQAHVQEHPRPLVSKNTAVIRLTSTSSRQMGAGSPSGSKGRLPHPAPQGSGRGSRESSTRAPSPLFTVSMDAYDADAPLSEMPSGERIRLVLGRADSSSPRNSAPPSVVDGSAGRTPAGSRSVVQRKGRSSSVGPQQSGHRRSQSASLRGGSANDHLERSQSSYRFGHPPGAFVMLSKTQLEQAKSVWNAVSSLLVHSVDESLTGAGKGDTTLLERVPPAGLAAIEEIPFAPTSDEGQPEAAADADPLTTTFVTSPGLGKKGKGDGSAGRSGGPSTAMSKLPAVNHAEKSGMTSSLSKGDAAPPVITPPQGSHREVLVTTVAKKTPTTVVKPRAQHAAPGTSASPRGTGTGTGRKSSKDIIKPDGTAEDAVQESLKTHLELTHHLPEAHAASTKPSVEEERAATTLSAFWRGYQVRQSLAEVRAEKIRRQATRQETQYRLVAARRIKQFFLQLLCRRHVRQKASHEHFRKHSPGSGSQPQPLSGSSRAESSHKQVRDRFLRAKEQRRAMNASLSMETASDSSTLTTNPSGRDRPASPSLVLAPVVSPLPLQENGITTKDIINYNRDSESFELQVLHRLQRAPVELVYVLSVISMKNPHFPPMGYAAMRDKSTPSFEALVEKAKGERNRKTVHLRPSAVPRPLRGMDDSVAIPFSFLKKLQAPSMGSVSLSGNDLTMSSSAASVPWSPRYQSFVRINELREAQPIVKDFKRPFERWGTANALVRRLFTAAAIYSWKLIFSHTPHDDFKQRQLQTPEEKAARLDRVEQRNRMILACYCVHSEREWLREASKDISFVGQIWNPKKSLDPNDPDLHRHCKETFEFVEDFLYQCFPTVSALEEVPSFLLGAGVFFLLKESLNYSEYIQPSHILPWGSAFLTKPTDSFPTAMVREQPLSGWSQVIQQRYEVCDLLDRVVQHQKTLYQGKVSKVMSSSTLPKVESGSVRRSSTNSRGSALETLFESVAAQSTPSHIFEAPRATRDKFSLDHSEAAEPGEAANRVLLVGVPVTVSSAKHFFRDYEESLLVHISRWIRQKRSESKPKIPESEMEYRNFTVVYPKKYLVSLAETIAKVLFGLQLELEVCEELDCVD
eukprot:gene4286-3102_t